MNKRKLLFTLFMTMLMMMLCPQRMMADDYTITCLSGTAGSNSSEEAKNLFDGDKSTKWCSNSSTSSPAYVIFKIPNKARLSQYVITDGDDTWRTNYYQYKRHWDSWTIYGANFTSDEDATPTSTEWTAIKSESGHKYTSSFQESQPQETYTISDDDYNNTVYQYYMVRITAVGENGTIQQMAEMACTFTCPHIDENGASTLSTKTFPSTCTTHAHTADVCSLCGEQLNVVTDETAALLAHDYGTSGICSMCGIYEQPQLTDGYYQLGKPGHLL